MQVTRVTIQADCEQHCKQHDVIIMHAGYKGYKPICIQVTRVTSQLQATQYVTRFAKTRHNGA